MICETMAQRAKTMSKPHRPFRSVLYIPASKPRALEKARSLPVDAIIFDLEDAVSAGEKDSARSALAEALAVDGYDGRTRIVRINRLDTPWGRDDATAALDMRPDAVLLPKVDSAADLDALAGIVGDMPLWAMIESAAGALGVEGIVRHPRLEGIVMGLNDLAVETRARSKPGRGSLMTALGLGILAARAAGIVAVDGVYNAFRDLDGLRTECEQGRDMGFDGKTLIHPCQLEVANEVFAPTEDEIALARRHIAAFREAEESGQGVAVVDGSIVENLHADAARRVLDQVEAIAEFQGNHGE